MSKKTNQKRKIKISFLYDMLLTELSKEGGYKEEIKLIRESKKGFVTKGF